MEAGLKFHDKQKCAVLMCIDGRELLREYQPLSSYIRIFGCL